MTIGVDYPGITVTFLCHDGRGNYLFNQRSQNCRDEHGRWDPGGGSVEFGQTIEQCLRQEIKEEYCTDIINHQFLGYLDVHRQQNKQPTHWLALFFKVRVVKAKVKNGEPHKFDDLGWFKLDNLPSPMHSQWDRFYQTFKDKL